MILFCLVPRRDYSTPVFHLWDYAMSSTSMKPTPGKKIFSIIISLPSTVFGSQQSIGLARGTCSTYGTFQLLLWHLMTLNLHLTTTARALTLAV